MTDATAPASPILSYWSLLRRRFVFHSFAFGIAFITAGAALFFIQRTSLWFAVATGGCPPCLNGTNCVPCHSLSQFTTHPVFWVALGVIVVLFISSWIGGRRVRLDSSFLVWLFFYMSLLLLISLVELFMTTLVVMYANQI